MKPFFEIRSINGYARNGRMHFGEKKLETPFVLIPHDYEMSKEFKLNEINTYPISQSLVFGKFISSNQINNPNSPIFISNLSIFGNNYEEPDNNIELHARIHSEILINQKSIDEFHLEHISDSSIPSFEYRDCDSTQTCLILHETPPGRASGILKDYERALNQKRLIQYSSESDRMDVFPYKIIGYNFSDDEEKLNDTLEFLKTNNGYGGIYIKDLYKNSFFFNDILKVVLKIKNEVSPNTLIIIGGTCPLAAIPLLVYLGIDGFDLSNGVSMASNGLYVSDFGGQWIDQMSYLPCNCKYCEEIDHNIEYNRTIQLTSKTLELNMKHFIWKSIDEIKKVRTTFRDNYLREYVECKCQGIPELVSLLRMFDNDSRKDKNSRFRFVMNSKLQAPSSLSHIRPEIMNFINRLKENVYPDSLYQVILLLPCSASKPYSNSPSHQRFGKAIRSGLNNNRDRKYISEIIITSPLGIVPRELEDLYPAAHYNVSVTGSWDDEEIENSAQCLVDWIKKYPKPTPIIAHVSGGYRLAVERAEKILNLQRKNGESSQFFHESDIHFIYSVNMADDSVGSESALAILTKEISKIFANRQLSDKEIKKLQLTERTDDELKIGMISAYQFGKNAKDVILGGGCVLAESKTGLYADVQQYDGLGKRIIGRLYHDSGFIKLNFDGGELLHEIGNNILFVSENEIKGSTIFPPILKKINNSFLSPGDLVAIVNNNDEYVGIAEMSVSGQDAKKLEYGAVASIIKKKSIQGAEKNG